MGETVRALRRALPGARVWVADDASEDDVTRVAEVLAVYREQKARAAEQILSRWVGKKGGETEYLWERGLASHTRKRA